AVDLRAIPHDAGVGHEPRPVARPEPRELVGVEARKRSAEIRALAEDRDPRQTGLKSVEEELLEERAVDALRDAPFVVVIREVERVRAGPGAWLQARQDSKGLTGAASGSRPAVVRRSSS